MLTTTKEKTRKIESPLEGKGKVTPERSRNQRSASAC